MPPLSSSPSSSDSGSQGTHDSMPPMTRSDQDDVSSSDDSDTEDSGDDDNSDDDDSDADE